MPPAERLCEMYHGSMDSHSQRQITESMPERDSKLHCVVATITFGLGIDTPDISYVIHWGAPTDIMAYWQEVGRAGRDGRKAKAKMYLYPLALDSRRVDKALMELLHDVLRRTRCFREGILTFLSLKEMSAISHQNSDCCIVCDESV
ncbi:ATP-dependent DNA helicase RecQ-like [Diadema antillarum]|uniref:ATP-dependent DNA helicase RecQ-like n=1 Tax=Diadema antillarum TaxID=105358 RepID=UPI003A85D1C6